MAGCGGKKVEEWQAMLDEVANSGVGILHGEVAGEVGELAGCVGRRR